MAESDDLFQRIERDRPERLTPDDAEYLERLGRFYPEPFAPLITIHFQDGLTYRRVDDRWLRDDVALNHLAEQGLIGYLAVPNAGAPSAAAEDSNG